VLPTGRPADLLALVFSVVLVIGAPMGLGAQAPPAEAPTESGFVEAPFDVTSAGLLLPGTLTRPSESRGPIPVAVIVAGSGPTDRNGNGPLVQTDMYAQLAHGLAQRGIASVRYDKRGIGEGAKTIDHSALTLDDYVNDVSAVARIVAADSQYSKVYLIGHSEGAGLVLQAANRGTPVAGIAMLSGIGRPLQEVLHDQFSLATDSLTVRRIDEAFARFLQGEDVPDAPEIARPVLVPGYRRLIVSMAAYDPEGEVARSPVPVLIVQGGLDLQVDVRDAERLHAAQPAAKVLVLPTANHVFKAASSRDPAAQMSLYQDRSIPIVPELVEGIADWIASGIADPSP
jgi:pimeloyl-ACP methyl ester carboxylesterase